MIPQLPVAIFVAPVLWTEEQWDVYCKPGERVAQRWRRMRGSCEWRSNPVCIFRSVTTEQTMHAETWCIPFWACSRVSGQRAGPQASIATSVILINARDSSLIPVVCPQKSRLLQSPLKQRRKTKGAGREQILSH